MKKSSIIAFITLLLIACNNEEVIQQETWDVVLSRTATNGQHVKVIGKKDGTKILDGILIPSSSENETALWQDTPPSWPGNDYLEMYVISPVPEDGDIPQIVDVNEGKTWMIDFLPSCHKPNQFTLTHLMAKLKVHIRINNDENHQQPKNVKMTLFTEAEIDYSGKKLKNHSGKNDKNVPLGDFSKDDNTEEGSDNWICNDILIIPQTLEKGKVCLVFTDSNGKEYTFTPEKDLILLPGKVSHLFLGIAVNQLIFLSDGVAITPWVSETSNSGYAVEE